MRAPNLTWRRCTISSGFTPCTKKFRDGLTSCQIAKMSVTICTQMSVPLLSIYYFQVLAVRLRLHWCLFNYFYSYSSSDTVTFHTQMSVPQTWARVPFYLGNSESLQSFVVNIPVHYEFGSMTAGESVRGRNQNWLNTLINNKKWYSPS